MKVVQICLDLGSVVRKECSSRLGIGQQLGLRFNTGGVDSLRQLLREHRQSLVTNEADNGEKSATACLPTPDGISDSGNAAHHHTSIKLTGDESLISGSCGVLADSWSSSSGRNDEGRNSPHPSASLIKDLLRIFTRKVPGGLVPDELVRGFMQAYSELRSPQERLAFFRLVTGEMGLSVPEVISAVRLWDTAASRRAAVAAAGAGAACGAPACDATAEAAHGSAAAQGGAPAACNTAACSSPPAAAASAAPAEEVLHAADAAALYRAADRLGGACRPLYTQLFLPVSQAPEGLKFLVDMRADLLQLLAAGGPGALSPGAAAPLRALADHLRQSLAEWFSVGLLHLQPISWQHSPAALLERVMRCEAVHPLGGSWAELRRRLGPGRAVFAFTHPCLPGEPLVVLHTALMQGPAAAMSEILLDERQQPEQQPDAASFPSPSHPLPPPPPPPPTTAVFYSISAGQPGLRGVELGTFLIKRVAELLRSQHPSIRQLVTLSPLPSFRSWLTSRLMQQQQQQPQQWEPAGEPAGPGSSSSSSSSTTPQASSSGLLRPDEQAAVLRLAGSLGWAPGQHWAPPPACGDPRVSAGGAPAAAAAATALSWLLEDDRWLRSPSASSGGSSGAAAAAVPHEDQASAPAALGEDRVAAPPGVVHCEQEQQQQQQEPGDVMEAEWVLRPLLLRLAARYLLAEKRRRFALCPVAHFHLRNGASCWRLNWRADMSPLGLQRSFGIMVNYDYQLGAVYDNNRKYLLQHEVQAHPRVLELLQ